MHRNKAKSSTMSKNDLSERINRWSAAEVADLLSVGYRVQLHVRTIAGQYIIKLRHTNNRNTMLIETRPDGFMLYKNGRLVKNVTANLKT